MCSSVENSCGVDVSMCYLVCRRAVLSYFIHSPQVHDHNDWIESTREGNQHNSQIVSNENSPNEFGIIKHLVP
jgi:hypothetical protein